MPEIKPYQEMIVECVECSPNPAAKVAVAMGITMRNDPEHIMKPVSRGLCKKLIRAEHMSLFEHVQFTFLIQNVSRSFLAQITRQRTAKPTSGSQHYQNYQDYPCMVHENMTGELPRLALESSVSAYEAAIESGVPKEEARQLLPNACAVNYYWTIDALNLFKFLRTRLCNRNVLEMRIFAQRALSLAKEYFPQLFDNCGPQCVEPQGCQQHLLNMQCEEKYYKVVN